MELDVQPMNFMDIARSTVVHTYPVELLHVKILFLQKQYRRCITTCRELLKWNGSEETTRPLHQTFIQFFLGAAHDELARATHHYSQAKLPAFSQAEQLYEETLDSLPTAEQCTRALAESIQEDSDDPFVEQEPISRYPSSTTLGVNDNPRTSLQIRSPPMSPHIRSDSLPMPMNLPMTSPGPQDCEFDDLESHQSYDQIMTPNRVPPKLERDYSSISLLERPPPQMSQGLMRPIPLGELARNYHVPPKLPYSGAPNVPSKLPRLQTSSVTGSPVRKQLRTQSEQASPAESPVPPVSPLGSESVASDASTVSSISPDTPTGPTGVPIPSPQKIGHRSPRDLEEHLQGMRMQLQTHIRLLQEAKQQTITMQSERAAARLAPNEGGRLTALVDAAHSDKRIQQSESFWSFTPEVIKSMEKQKRIEAGRERGWTRKRFDPTRYRLLAEKALAEL